MTVHLALGVGAGAVLALSHPPVGASWLALLVPALLLAGVDTAGWTGRRAWPVGAFGGLVGYGVVLAWIVAPAGFVGWGLLVAIQGAWWALWAGVVSTVPPAWRPVRPLVVAIAWVGVDALRGLVPLRGFAWGSLGAAAVDLPWLTPLARLAGEKAMTLAVVLLGAAAWEAARGPIEAARDATGRIVWPRVRQALPAGRTGAAWLAGSALVVTMATVEPPAPTGEADVLAVQPSNFETFAGTGRELDVAIAGQAVDLTDASLRADGPAELVVWPESTIDADPARVPELAQLLRTGGSMTDGHLLAGATLDGPRPRTFRNVALSVDAGGAVVDHYQKRQLVPFGEYVPFRAALDWFPPLAQVPRDGLPGGTAHRVTVGELDVATVICFETLFGQLVRGNLLAGDAPADLVVAVTNDASFGRGGEAAQHVAQSQLRALETGRWVVHAAISGESAFVDPDGLVHDRTELFEATTIRRTVTVTTGRTPFLVTGDWLAPVTMSGLLVLAAASRLTRRREPPPPEDGP